MLSKVYSCAVVGLDCEIVEVEIDISNSPYAFVIVGLPDKAVDEAKERVRLAIKNSNLEFPRTKVTVNLAPADIRKEGPAYDLPMAIGILASNETITFDPAGSFFVGELSLDGKLRHTNSILPMAIFARESGIRKLFVPEVNAEEAAQVDGVEVYPVKSLAQLVLHLAREQVIEPYKRIIREELNNTAEYSIDFAFIKGQDHAKRALEIAAAGAHNVLLSGPPGSGKTLLARTLPSILPSMTQEEILEVSKIYSIAGMLPSDKPLVRERPFRSPHHSASAVALVGGGTYPRPGEISLAHRGVLFVDEFPEFSRHVVEHLRQPMEDGVVTVSRASGSVNFPARFMLVASQNPCPCGFLTEPQKECICSQGQIARYNKKISGPILDRIDLHVEVPRVEFEELTKEVVAESSREIRDRVNEARERQRARFREEKYDTNAEMSSNEIKKFCRINEKSLELLKSAVKNMHLSARSYHRMLKVGRTIADLARSDDILPDHIAESIQYRFREQ